ncbi:hypothetical protein ACC702_37790, partial [Rhizobium ruizarguesonis]
KIIIGTISPWELRYFSIEATLYPYKPAIFCNSQTDVFLLSYPQIERWPIKERPQELNDLATLHKQ